MADQRLEDEIQALRARASFYDLEAGYAGPDEAHQLQAKAERLARLAEQLEREHV